MRYLKGKSGKRSHSDGSFWISYSDLMSALVLVFVLVMFYSVYQYFDMLEVKTAELLRQSGILDQKEEELTLSRSELEEKEALLQKGEEELAAQTDKLNAAETELLAQRAKLLLQEDTLSALQEKLASQEDALNQAQVSLDEALKAQQAQQALLDDQQSMMAAQQEKLDKLVGVRAAIVEDLLSALAASNISGAGVDESGAIVFDSEMMFDVGKAFLKGNGKEFLGDFIPNYIEVLMSEDYAKYVSQIIIEGHTDTDGTFLNNMQLSQERAYAVLNYLLSDEFHGISDEMKARLEQVVTVNGRSYSDPIYKEDGTIDMAASRRVVIKFRMNDEDMVNEMLSILDGMNN